MEEESESPHQRSPLDFSRDYENFEHEIFVPSVRGPFERGSVPQARNAFMKNAQWCPDGTRLLTTFENGALAIFNVDPVLIAESQYYIASSTPHADHTSQLSLATPSSGDAMTGSSVKARTGLSATTQIATGESIFDTKWYPKAHAHDPDADCFLTTCRDHPVHLWNAKDGTLRCSYRCYNRFDELEAAHSITFNLDGTRIYAGCKSAIRIFDVCVPGRSYTEQLTGEGSWDMRGQKGIISALAFNPDFSGAYAAGTYSSSVGIYVEDMDGCALELPGLPFDVTCLRWAPDGAKLWTGGRSHPDIICWDVRNTRQELGRVSRPLSTNQRLCFDLDPWGSYLVTGDEEGRVLVYDTASFDLVKSTPSSYLSDSTTIARGSGSRNNVKGLDAECSNSVTFHPYAALLAVSRGQRHFDDISEDDSDGDVDEGVDVSMQTESPTQSVNRGIERRSSLQLIRIPHIKLTAP